MTEDSRPTYPARVALVCPCCRQGIQLLNIAAWTNAYAAGEQWHETCRHCGTSVWLHMRCIGTDPPIPADAYPDDHPLEWPIHLPDPKYAAADRRNNR